MFLNLLNPFERVKMYSERRKGAKKLLIYKALEQKGLTPPSLTMHELSEVSGLCAEELEPLLYDMIGEGTIREGPFPRTYTRYHNY